MGENAAPCVNGPELAWFQHPFATAQWVEMAQCSDKKSTDRILHTNHCHAEQQITMEQNIVMALMLTGQSNFVMVEACLVGETLKSCTPADDSIAEKQLTKTSDHWALLSTAGNGSN